MNMKLTKYVLSTVLVFCLMLGLSSATALAEITGPVIEGNAIYGNGFPLLIVDAGSNNTTVYWDKNDDGVGVVDEIVVENADLSWFTIYGGADTVNTGSTKITMTGGYVYLIYGGGVSDGDIEGNTDVTITGGTIDSHLYGGGNGGDVSGNTKLTITGGNIRGDIYGGGYYGYIEGSTQINISTNISQNVVYGGGNNGDVWENTNINIAKSTGIVDIYGGGANDGVVYGERNLTVSGEPTIGNNSASAGNGIRINSASVTNGVDSFAIGADELTDGASIIVVLPWDFDRGVNGDAVITNAKDTYIANNNTGIIQFSSIGKPEAEVDTDGDLTVKVEPIRYDPTVDEDEKAIYGNGSPLLIVEGAGGNTTVYHDENDNGMIDGEDAVVASSTNNTGLSEYTIYGGAADNNDGDVELSGTKITMTGGSVETIVGGGLNSRIAGNTEVIIKNGNITTIYGGGMDEAPDDPDNDIFGNIGGNTNVIVEGGMISTIYGGSKNGDIGDNTNITVKGGTILNIYGGCNKGDIVGNAITTISGGDISTVSAGGSDINDVIAIAILAIKGNAMVNVTEYFDQLHVSDNIQIGLPDSGITIPEGSDLYIGGSLGNKARIYMTLPDDAKLGDIIATDANSSDIYKFTLLNNPADFILKLNYNHLILSIYSPPIDKGNNEESPNNPLTEDSGLGENTVSKELGKTELQDKVDNLLEQNKTDLQIKVDTPQGTEKVEITLDPEGLEDLATEEDSSLTMESDLGNIAFDNEGLKQLTTNSGNSFTVSMTKVDSEQLSDEQKAAAKDSEIFNVNIATSDGSAFELKDGASVNITLSHPLKEGETGSNLLGFVLDANGIAIPQMSIYSSEDQTISFDINSGDTFFVQSTANGWLSAGNDWYYINDGLASGWQTINNNRHCLDEFGKMLTGWQEQDGNLHFLGLKGKMVIGWQYIENDWYYFNQDGAMAIDTTIDGHNLGADGKLISSIN